MAVVYILQSDRDRRYYIGSTENLIQRIRHHIGGHTPSTKRMGTMKLVFSQTYSTLRAAREIERRLKRLKRRDYIEKIIQNGKIEIIPKLGA